MSQTPRPGRYVEETASRAIAPASSGVTAFVGHALEGPVNRVVPVGAYMDYAKTFGGPAASSELSYAVLQFFRNGGQKALIVRVPELDTGLPGLDMVAGRASSFPMGLRCLEDDDEFELLCVPDCTRPREPSVAVSEFRHDAMAELWGEAMDLCRRKRALLIVDAPVDARDTDAAGAWVRGLPRESGGFAAAFAPWLRIDDPLNEGSPRLCAPSGTIAGLIARTDRQAGLWTAPAGIDADLRQVSSLSQSYSEAQQGILHPLSLNLLREFPDRGILCWSARTLSVAPEFQYVPVRRLASHIERSLQRGLAWTAVESGSEALRATVRREVTAFMDGLFRRGGFPATSPTNAYFVKCGPDTMTQSDIDNGRLIVEIGFAPLQPAEFVILRIELTTRPPNG